MTLIVLFVLCLLGRPLLAIACDVHDVTHHDVAEMVQVAVTGDMPEDPDGESLLHDLLHIAHTTGSAIEMYNPVLRVAVDAPLRVALPDLRNTLSNERQRSLFRPPISV